MILNDEHLAQIRATVERSRLHGVASGINITPDALEALLDRVQVGQEMLSVLESSTRQLIAFFYELETGKTASDKVIDKTIELSKPGTPVGDMVAVCRKARGDV